MIVDVYDSCFDDEKYSGNGINLTLHRCIPDNEMELKFEDDGGKIIFNVGMKWKDFINMVKRIDD